MPRVSSNFVPTYRKHKPTAQAVVTLDARDRHLGRYGTAASKAEYDRIIAEWLAGGRQAKADGVPLTVNEVILAYLRHMDGTPNGNQCLKDAVKPLKAIFGREPADSFGPKRFRIVRQAMIEMNRSRNYVNHQADRIRRLFKWAASEELVSGEIFHALQTVPGIRKGTPGVRESVRSCSVGSPTARNDRRPERIVFVQS